MAPLKTMRHAASLAITSARILVAVDICSSPPLSAINPSRICCLTLSSCSVVMLSLAALLKRGKPVLEGVHVAWRSAFTFQSCHFVSSQVADSFSHSCFVVAKYWQSRKNLFCSLAVRRATRIISPLLLSFRMHTGCIRQPEMCRLSPASQTENPQSDAV